MTQVPVRNRLPIGANRDLVFALERILLDLAQRIDEAGYRNIPKFVSNSTPTLENLGRVQEISAGITLPANVFSPIGVEGHVFNVFNNTGGALTLTQGSGLTLRLGGTATTGSRTIAAYGMVWCWYLSTTVCIVGGHVT